MELRNKWIEASELPQGEKVYLKKDWFGWRVVEPWKNEDGSINYFNLLLGGKRNLFILFVILIIALSIYLASHEILTQYKWLAENYYNSSLTCQASSNSNVVGLNLSSINWSNS